jgi:hypothetical protein
MGSMSIVGVEQKQKNHSKHFTAAEVTRWLFLSPGSEKTSPLTEKMLKWA